MTQSELINEKPRIELYLGDCLEIISTMDKLEKEKSKIIESLDHHTYEELCKISGQTEIED